MINVSEPLTPMRLGQIHSITLCRHVHAVTKVHAVPPLHRVHPRFVKRMILGHMDISHRPAAHYAKQQ